jgi:CubicO group peptidase (beta-lactamase class C family)
MALASVALALLLGARTVVLASEASVDSGSSGITDASAELDSSAASPGPDWDAVTSDIAEYVDSYSGGASVEAIVVKDGTVVAQYSRSGSGTVSTDAADGEVHQAPTMDGQTSSRADESAASSASAGSRADGSADSASSGSADSAFDDSEDAGIGNKSDSDYLERDQGTIVGQQVGDASETQSATELTTSSIVNWGRCSDLLVWASVMQLVEQGKIDLDASIRSELPDGVSLPEGSGVITMLDLMNHTTGFNVSMSSSSSLSSQGRSILDIIGLYDVTQAFDPGEIVSYSSYDVALAAAVVEQVSGMDICTYVTQNILEPLGMQDTAVAVGLSAARMAQSSDERTAEVASRLTTLTAPANASVATLADVIESLRSDLTDASLTESIDGTALTCIGSMENLAKLASALVAPADAESIFAYDQTKDEFFATSRTFPALSTRRIAHGMFALPTMPSSVGALGVSAGVTCGAYMNRQMGTVVVVLVGESSRQGLVQGIAGVAMRSAAEREAEALQAISSEGDAQAESSLTAQDVQDAESSSDAQSLTDASSSNSSNDLIASEGDGQTEETAEERETGVENQVDWSGVYQDAALPTSGPAKLLSFFERTRVSYDVETDTLTINGTPTTSLGEGVYATAEPSGNDPYRFHVGLARGLEFSRVTGDSYAVPLLTLVVETCLVIGGLYAFVMSVGYTVVGVGSLLRARIRRIPWQGQKSCLALALITAAASSWTLISMLAGENVFLATMSVECILNAVYSLCAIGLIIWIFVTRWRGTARTKRSLAAAILVCFAAGLLAFNFLYWEMLP